MSLEEWEEYVAVKRVRAWGPVEEEFVASLPPDEQDLVYELAARLNVEPVEPGTSGVGSPSDLASFSPARRRPGSIR